MYYWVPYYYGYDQASAMQGLPLYQPIPRAQMMPPLGPGSMSGPFPTGGMSPIPGMFPGQMPGQIPGQGQTPLSYPGQTTVPGQSQPSGQGGVPSQGPSTPPPSYVPPKPPAQAYAIDAPSMSGCLFNWTYVWLSDGSQMWIFPVFVGPTSIAGYTWPSGSPRPLYFGIDAKKIDTFAC